MTVPTTYTPVDGITLVCADARDAVQEAPGNVRFVATDPPYKLQSGGNSGTHFTGGRLAKYANDGKPVDCDITWDEIMAVVDALAADQSDIMVMASASLANIHRAFNAAMNAGLRHHNTCYWNKGAPTPGRWLMMHVEYILYLYKGKAVPLNSASQKQEFKYRRSNETDHPTEKPVALMRRWVSLVGKPGDLVADPFMGSGTTGIAAVLEGRRFYGVEKDPEYFDMACARIDEAIKRRAWLERNGFS